ncbi:hypothetical protein K432DRAFT_339537 [Lepidopterella palustris CBS 459.81]|uniref:Rhodopsin domain-containing protein n=1 Tax=Lepidopterella palustris CBS 459.81 TaxID=1314670 RepID=A0A8E2J975_9PEZI|nr:hypothetical protein K432DRAFT_339537 [Lepidopterella palustris CBS 459.81]
MGLFKPSVLTQYLRFFQVNRVFRWSCFVLIAVVILHTLTITFVSAFICSPVAYFWDRLIPNGKCLNMTVFWLTASGIHTGTDIVIFMLPFPIIWKLHISRKQRLQLMLVFGHGFFLVIVSVLRLPTVWEFSKTKDPTYDHPLMSAWTIIEANTVVLCTSLPVLKLLVYVIFLKLRTTVASTKASYSLDFE